MTPEKQKYHREYNRMRRADPAYRALWAARTKHRRATEPGFAMRLAQSVNRRRLKQIELDPIGYRARANAAQKAWCAGGVKEAVVEKYLIAKIKDANGFCPKIISPGLRGAPDRIVFLPNHPAYFVELKRTRSGKLGSWQQRYHDELRRCGQQVFVISSIEAVDRFLREILCLS
jgi:hypothetical protein